MNGHAQDWIDAYFDGALSPNERYQAERHLGGCEACRQLLDQRRQLSSLLQEAQPAITLKSERQFISEIALLMDRHPAHSPARASWAWFTIPVILFLAWGFVEAVVVAGSLVSLFPGLGHQLVGLVNQPVLHLPPVAGYGQLIGWFNPFGFSDWAWWTASIGLLVISLLYAGWLAAWWAYYRIGLHWNALERN